MNGSWADAGIAGRAAKGIAHTVAAVTSDAFASYADAVWLANALLTASSGHLTGLECDGQGDGNHRVCEGLLASQPPLLDALIPRSCREDQRRTSRHTPVYVL